MLGEVLDDDDPLIFLGVNKNDYLKLLRNYKFFFFLKSEETNEARFKSGFRRHKEIVMSRLCLKRRQLFDLFFSPRLLKNNLNSA